VTNFHRVTVTNKEIKTPVTLKLQLLNFRTFFPGYISSATRPASAPSTTPYAHQHFSFSVAIEIRFHNPADYSGHCRMPSPTLISSSLIPNHFPGLSNHRLFLFANAVFDPA